MKRRPAMTAVYEGAVTLGGWGLLLRLTLADPPARALPMLLFLLVAVILKREGFHVAPLVTHSLVGVALLAALISLGPVDGAWVAALSGLLFLAARFPEVQHRSGLARWRLAFFGGGLNALTALGSAWFYAALGGRPLTSLTWADLLPVIGLSLAWFLGDHLGWSLRIALADGLAGLREFLRVVGPYSILVELLPLPLSSVLATAYLALGAPAFALLSLLIVAVGEVLRRLNLALRHTRARVADLSTLNAFSQALLASKMDVDALCRLLRSHTAATVPAPYLWLGLYQPDDERLEPALDAGDGTAPPDAGLLAWMRKHRAPLCIRDAQHEALPFSPSAAVAYRSALYVPLQAAAGMIGLLAAESPVPGAYGDDSLRTVVTFANQTAMAIQNARTYEAEQRRARQVATVGEVSRRVVAILGMERLFAGVVDLIRDAFGYYHVELLTVDPTDGAITFQASTNPLIQEQGLAVAPGQGLIGWVAEVREPVVVDDVSAEPRYRPVEGLEGTRSEVVLPLKIEERLVGILAVQSDRLAGFGEDDLFVLQTLADQVAIAIEDNRLYRAERRRRQLADTLRETASALNSTLEPQAVLDLVLTQLQRVIRYDSAAILKWSDEAFCIVAGRGDYASPDRCLTTLEDGQLRRLLEAPSPLVFDGGDTSDGEAAAVSLAAPLMVKGKLIGALVLERQGTGARYTADEVQVASAFASQAAVAIENARLYEAEQRRVRQLATIAEVGQRVASILDLDELFVQVVNLVREEFGYYHVSIFTTDTQTDTLVFRANTSPDSDGRKPHIRLGQGITGWVAANGEALLANDVAQEPRYLADELLPETRSEMSVPLRVEGRTVGVLDIQAGRPDAFGADDLFIIQTLADQIAVAIENARLYAAQQEEVWVSTALLQVAETLANLISIDEVLDAVIRLVPLLVGVDRCLIFLRDDDAGTCRAVRIHGLSGAERDALLAAPLETLAPNLWQAVNESPAPVGLDALRGVLAEEAREHLGLASGLALPLRAGGETIGAMLAGHEKPASTPNRNRRAILAGIAGQAAMAIRNANLYVAQRQEAWFSTALLQVADLAGSTRDLDEILAGLVRLTPMLAGVDRCCVILWDRETGQYVPCQAHGLDDALRERYFSQPFAPGRFPLFDRVREMGETVIIEDVSTSDLVPRSLAEDAGMVSVLALPLRSQDEVLGIMLVDYAGRAQRFPAQRVALLTGIANQAAIAIENVQLYRESLQRERMAQELRVARQIQATFLPEAPPSLPGWSIAVTSRPVREVGGDFYDFISLGRDRLGLVIADVSDKGVPAALFMALSRTVMRAVAVEGHSPAQALGRANDLLLADSRSGMFVTLFYGVLNRKTGELAFASAGHTPPYWYRDNPGELIRLRRAGVALGVIAKPEFEEDCITLRPGDALVLCTDGVTESMDPDLNQFGEEGLRGAIRSAGPQAAAGLAEAINEAVQTFARGAPQFDDYTLMALTRDR